MFNREIEMNYYTPEEVANILKVRKHTVWNWLRKGSLKGIRVNGKLWRIPVDALDEFINRDEMERAAHHDDPAPIKGTNTTNNIAQYGGVRK